MNVVGAPVAQLTGRLNAVAKLLDQYVACFGNGAMPEVEGLKCLEEFEVIINNNILLDEIWLSRPEVFGAISRCSDLIDAVLDAAEKWRENSKPAESEDVLRRKLKEAADGERHLLIPLLSAVIAVKRFAGSRPSRVVVHCGTI